MYAHRETGADVCDTPEIPVVALAASRADNGFLAPPRVPLENHQNGEARHCVQKKHAESQSTRRIKRESSERRGR